MARAERPRAGRSPAAVLRRCGLIAAVPLLAACAVATPAERAAQADALAAAQGWQKQRFAAPPFTLLGYVGPANPGPSRTLAVYIEGDGLAWEHRTRPSSDPTPIDPVGLKLALQDRSRYRLYLARPCQYLPPAELARCNPVYWQGRRLAPEVIAALDAALAQQPAHTSARDIALFGWSGGGAAAALLAARRHDVVRLVTIAADLDLARWTRLKGVDPLEGSLDPADQAAALQAIPQLHFVGLDDDIVPPAVLDGFLAHMPDRSRVTVVRVPDFSHHCCWARDWPVLLRRAGEP